MKAAIFNGPRSIELGERPGRQIQEPTDAVVCVVLGCVCGSDLWYYRGLSPHALGPIGHEFIGMVEEVGSEVHAIKKGDLVIAPFTYCDGTCATCRAGWPSNCLHGGSFGNHGIDGGQGEAVRSPLADPTLVKVPGSGYAALPHENLPFSSSSRNVPATLLLSFLQGLDLARLLWRRRSTWDRVTKKGGDFS